MPSIHAANREAASWRSAGWLNPFRVSKCVWVSIPVAPTLFCCAISVCANPVDVQAFSGIFITSARAGPFGQRERVLALSRHLSVRASYLAEHGERRSFATTRRCPVARLDPVGCTLGWRERETGACRSALEPSAG